MKKLVFIFLAAILILNSGLYAAESPLLSARNKIFEQSKKIKTLLSEPKDAILVSTLWDACIIAVSQLDAYFSMVGIYNTIKKEDLTQQAVNYLSSWLIEIKSTNDLNIKGLDNISISEDKVKDQIKILKIFFLDLNNNIQDELKKLDSLKNSFKKA